MFHLYSHLKCSINIPSFISLTLEHDVNKNLSQLDYAPNYRPRTCYRTKSFTVNIYRKGFHWARSSLTAIIIAKYSHQSGSGRTTKRCPASPPQTPPTKTTSSKTFEIQAENTKRNISENVTVGPLWFIDNGIEMQYSLQKLTEEIYFIQSYFFPIFFHPSIASFFSMLILQFWAFVSELQ